MNQRRVFLAACAACVAALAGGCFLVVFWGGELPDWLLRAELATFCSVALAYGFTASLPRLAPWLWSRPVQGAACVCLGVAAIFVPLQFVVAALFIGIGTRQVWAAACRDEEGKPGPVVTINAAAMAIEAEDGKAVWIRQPGGRHDVRDIRPGNARVG